LKGKKEQGYGKAWLSSVKYDTRICGTTMMQGNG
jgi:hypothetical protein